MATLSCTKADDVLSFTCFFLFVETRYIFFTFKITIFTVTERWVRDSATNSAHALLEELFLEKILLINYYRNIPSSRNSPRM